ncbi:hypothetical protein B0H16DRAFT_1716282 [Mycena metata]|uniref:Uncharacterized protein n=1 Tax=Mycena metata TaxID=1033252 RepID=A0AAD7JMV7_9AGAR|nr:hypothetical protein B0H16DRAFT_1716282 [Mycena metata]
MRYSFALKFQRGRIAAATPTVWPPVWPRASPRSSLFARLVRIEDDNRKTKREHKRKLGEINRKLDVMNRKLSNALSAGLATSAITRKAAINTLSIAAILVFTSRDAHALERTLDLLFRLKAIQRMPARPIVAKSNLEFLALASQLLVPYKLQSLGQARLDMPTLNALFLELEHFADPTTTHLLRTAFLAAITILPPTPHAPG